MSFLIWLIPLMAAGYGAAGGAAYVVLGRHTSDSDNAAIAACFWPLALPVIAGVWLARSKPRLPEARVVK